MFGGLHGPVLKYGGWQGKILEGLTVSDPGGDSKVWEGGHIDLSSRIWQAAKLLAIESLQP